MQIRLFYPELDHPAFGVIRAIAKDNTDTETGPSASVFLDSDNLVRIIICSKTIAAYRLICPMKRRIHVLPSACMCTQLLHADNKAAYQACEL